MFQDQVFRKLQNEHITDWQTIVDSPVLGVRRLRVIGFAFLATIWTALLLAKLEWSPNVRWSVAIAMLIAASAAITLWQWLETPSEN